MARTDQSPHLTLAPSAAVVEHPDVLAWLEEAKRLFTEAQERFEAGDILPALSSLAAVPPLHSMLIERCSVILDEGTAEPEPPLHPCGMYL